jgi:hypothetical protein
MEEVARRLQRKGVAFRVSASRDGNRADDAGAAFAGPDPAAGGR